MAKGSYKEERATSNSLLHSRHLCRHRDDDSRLRFRCSRWMRRGGFVDIKRRGKLGALLGLSEKVRLAILVFKLLMFANMHLIMFKYLFQGKLKAADGLEISERK
ncbi:hypothetical protein BHE74_00002511 [Ensete ventricosum]|nr:hypothetical protein GW17_00001174 [Ensete ventricosum]RWW88610.1 hypothetical protein BHE74_00002511 [Ensete ventricosum]